MPQNETVRKTSADISDFVWGAQAIGAILDRTPAQVRYLFSIGFFGDAVWKASHKTLVGSRQRLKSGDDFKRMPRKESA